jgi:DNA (cytosine-5)-methyltransferase 1
MVVIANPIPKFKKSLVKYRLPDFHLQKLLDHIQECVNKAPYGIVELVIDLFCGAGGTSEGIEQAKAENGEKCAVIIAGINHDMKAIYSQAKNHPLAYYSTEDIRTAKLDYIRHIVDICRVRWPQCPIIVWGSFECTNHSNAKGGMSRDADSRTLPCHIFRYLKALEPDGFWVENVKEFYEWGPTMRKVIMYKGKAKYTLPEPLDPDKEIEYYQQKIEEGWICSSPLDKQKKKKKKGAPIEPPKPTWIPIKHLKGTYYQPWKKKVNKMGYHCEEWFLNAADFGVPQNRKRFFPIFMRTKWPITKPSPTHSKKPTGKLQQHVPIRECLDFSLEGESIFTPGKIKSERSFERYYKGLIMFVAGGMDEFIKTSNGGNHLHKIYSLDKPSRTVTCSDNQALVQAEYFITKYGSDSGEGSVNPGHSIDEPSRTVTTMNHFGLIQAQFLDVIYGNGTPYSIDRASPTIRTKDGLSIIDPQFFIVNYQGQSNASGVEDVSPTVMTREKLALAELEYFIINNYTSGGQVNSIDGTAPAVTTNPKSGVVSVEPFISSSHFGNVGSSIHEAAPTITAGRHHHYIINPSHGGNSGSIDNPSFTIVARQDKAPLYLVDVEHGIFAIAVYKTDTPMMIKIKEFMALYCIKDIKMRMLVVPELLKIQSFPENYFLAGGSTDQKKFIGNAVPPLLAKVIAESMHRGLVKYIVNKFKLAA